MACAAMLNYTSEGTAVQALDHPNKCPAMHAQRVGEQLVSQGHCGIAGQEVNELHVSCFDVQSTCRLVQQASLI